MNILRIRFEQIAKVFADKNYGQRVINCYTLKLSKEARTVQWLKRLAENEFYEEEEGLLYSSDIVK